MKMTNEMIKEVNECFKKFLKKHRVITEYKKMVGKDLDKLLSRYHELDLIKLLISGSFRWNNSKYRLERWEKLSNLWIEEYKSLISPKFEITKKTPGYGHVRWEGKCSKNVTIKDIIEKFYHPQFGGRDPIIYEDGTFSVIEHTD
jgi:hypothetical protein